MIIENNSSIKICTKTQKILCGNINCDVCNKRNILSKPNGIILISEFDKTKNKDIDIQKISFGSHQKLWWLCNNNHSYQASVNTRTNNGSGCRTCHYESTRKFTIEDKYNCCLRINDVKSTTETGDKNENFVFDLLSKCNKVKDVKLIGYMGGYADIILELNNDLPRLLQVKTITHTHNQYYMTNNKTYPNDMLIAMVDNTNTCFAVEFAKNIKVKKLSLDFGNKDAKYNSIMTTNKNEFCEKILNMIKYSTIFTTIEDQLNENQKKEYFMISRLQELCSERKMLYTHNNTNANCVDCYIYSHPIQLKYASLNQTHRKTIQITVRKMGGRIGSKNIKTPYHINDKFEYLIVELEKFHKQYCIIPKTKLLEMKCISSNTQNGTGICCVAPPNYDKYHWTMEYWNKWEIITP